MLFIALCTLPTTGQHLSLIFSRGQANVPMALKWMLCFEEPESRTLWLAKATPRAWLAPGEATLQAANLTTRYGRVSFSMAAQMNADLSAYTVHASVVLPASVVNSAPSGGIRLRIRAPIEHAGKLSNVTIGGKVWSAFSAAEETIDIAASELTASLVTDGLPHIVATFGGDQVMLREARFDPNRRVLATSASSAQPEIHRHNATAAKAEALAVPSCPGGITLVDSFQVQAAVLIFSLSFSHIVLCLCGSAHTTYHAPLFLSHWALSFTRTGLSTIVARPACLLELLIGEQHYVGSM